MAGESWLVKPEPANVKEVGSGSVGHVPHNLAVDFFTFSDE